MTMAQVRSPERPTAADGSLLDRLKRPRYEILPLNGIEDAVARHVPAEVKLTITASPSRGLDPTLELAERLRRRGYDVVPHLSARLIRDRSHLEEVIGRLEAADVREVFVIAGDPREAAGEFAGAAGLLSAMGELRARFAEIGISGYPESHHLISDETTIEAMFEKEPMATYIVSQICFDTDVIATWVRRVRDRGTRLPIWIGIPGVIDNRRAASDLAEDRARRVGPLPAGSPRLARAPCAAARLRANQAAPATGPDDRRASRQDRRPSRLYLQRARTHGELAPPAHRAADPRERQVGGGTTPWHR